MDPATLASLTTGGSPASISGNTLKDLASKAQSGNEGQNTIGGVTFGSYNKSSNTVLYVLIGAGALVAIGFLFMRGRR